jgi:hypothetical protein
VREYVFKLLDEAEDVRDFISSNTPPFGRWDVSHYSHPTPLSGEVPKTESMPAKEEESKEAEEKGDNPEVQAEEKGEEVSSLEDKLESLKLKE